VRCALPACAPVNGPWKLRSGRPAEAPSSIASMDSYCAERGLREGQRRPSQRRKARPKHVLGRHVRSRETADALHHSSRRWTGAPVDVRKKTSGMLGRPANSASLARSLQGSSIYRAKACCTCRFVARLPANPVRVRASTECPRRERSRTHPTKDPGFLSRGAIHRRGNRAARRDDDLTSSSQVWC
jgi:hypothetical protein